MTDLADCRVKHTEFHLEPLPDSCLLSSSEPSGANIRGGTNLYCAVEAACLCFVPFGQLPVRWGLAVLDPVLVNQEPNIHMLSFPQNWINCASSLVSATMQELQNSGSSLKAFCRALCVWDAGAATLQQQLESFL